MINMYCVQASEKKWYDMEELPAGQYKSIVVFGCVLVGISIGLICLDYYNKCCKSIPKLDESQQSIFYNLLKSGKIEKDLSCSKYKFVEFHQDKIKNFINALRSRYSDNRLNKELVLKMKDFTHKKFDKFRNLLNVNIGSSNAESLMKMISTNSISSDMIRNTLGSNSQELIDLLRENVNLAVILLYYFKNK